MAVINPPFVIKGNPTPEQHAAKTFRQMVQLAHGSPWSSSAFAGGAGVYTGGGGHGVGPGSTELQVTQNGTPNMSVNVAGGQAVVRGTEAADQGCYTVYNDATANLVISAAHGSLARWDLIALKINDDDYSGSAATAELVVLTGTPAASPADPTITANCLVLARVVVGAAVSTITNANITDLRPRASALGGLRVCTSTTRPTGAALYPGLAVWETDNEAIAVYDGSDWMYPGALGEVATGTSTSAVNSASTADQTLVTQAFTAKAGRKYHIEAESRYYASTVTGDLALFKISVDGTLYRPAYGECRGNHHFMKARVTGLSAGSRTVTYTVQRFSGSGTITVYGDGTGGEHRLIITDAGPA